MSDNISVTTKTVVELDLKGYSDIARVLEDYSSAKEVLGFNAQIQGFVDNGLKAVKMKRKNAVMATTGDGAILIFDRPTKAHTFAVAVHEKCRVHNRDRTVAAQRWFRIGIATGEVATKRNGAKKEFGGTAISRAVRLEARAQIGEIAADAKTVAELPKSLQRRYSKKETVRGKRKEVFPAHRFVVISGLTEIVPPDNNPRHHTLTALRRTSKIAHQKLIKCLSGPRQTQSDAEVWTMAKGVVDPFKGQATVMQLTSLTRPETWLEKEWRDYHRRIRAVAMGNPRSFARRLHVVATKDMKKEDRFKVLFNLMIGEYLCGIRSRVLCLDDNQIAQLKRGWSKNKICRINGFTLLDCATITAQSGDYGILFSDILPYFVQNHSRFHLYQFADRCANNYVYYALRANFYRGWHQESPKLLHVFPQLLHDKCKRSSDFDRLFDVDSVRDCLRETSLKNTEIESALKRAIGKVARRFPALEPFGESEVFLEKQLSVLIKKLWPSSQ